jgi:hypothetical protein
MIILRGESRVADLGGQISQQHLYHIFSINFHVYHECPRGTACALSLVVKNHSKQCQCESNRELLFHIVSKLIHLEDASGAPKMMSSRISK